MGSVVQISARPKVTLSQTSRLFIDILYIAAVVIVRTINSRAKKNQRVQADSRIAMSENTGGRADHHLREYGWNAGSE